MGTTKESGQCRKLYQSQRASLMPQGWRLTGECAVQDSCRNRHPLSLPPPVPEKECIPSGLHILQQCLSEKTLIGTLPASGCGHENGTKCKQNPEVMTCCLNEVWVCVCVGVCVCGCVVLWALNVLGMANTCLLHSDSLYRSQW